MALLTLADLQARVLDRLDGNNLLYTSDELTDIINECYRLTNLSLGYQQGAMQVPGYSQENRVYYDLPLGFVIPLRISWEQRFLEKTSLAAITKANPNWTTDTTDNTGRPVSSWFPLGLSKFGIWPASSQGGQQILVTGILEVVPLVNPTDTVSWGQDVLAAFDFYCSHVLQLKESSRTFQQGVSDYRQYIALMRHQSYLDGWRQPRQAVEMRQNSKSN